MDVSKGKWWDEGVQLIEGCTRCSPGCDHCWSAALSYRFQTDKNGLPLYTSYMSLSGEITKFGQYDGHITIHPERLARFNKKKPTVFAIWNDLFHEWVTLDFVRDIHWAMQTHAWHKYIVLTKRHKMITGWFASNPDAPILSHIYYGLTVCTQAEADEKIPIFLQVPGKKFLCLEPLIENMDFGIDPWPLENFGVVVVGCETGSHRRPAKLEWIESIIDQCDAAKVLVFVKAIEINGKVSKDMDDWPPKFRRRELPWT